MRDLWLPERSGRIALRIGEGAIQASHDEGQDHDTPDEPFAVEGVGAHDP